MAVRMGINGSGRAGWDVLHVTGTGTAGVIGNPRSPGSDTESTSVGPTTVEVTGRDDEWARSTRLAERAVAMGSDLPVAAVR